MDRYVCLSSLPSRIERLKQAVYWLVGIFSDPQRLSPTLTHLDAACAFYDVLWCNETLV